MAQAHQKPPCEDCQNRWPDVDPENWEAWELWTYVGTQWRFAMGKRAGLDYSAVYAVANTLEIEITPALLNKIRALEAAVLSKEVVKIEQGN